MQAAWACLAGALLVVGQQPVESGGAAVPRPARAELRGCLVSVAEQIQIPAQEAGVLTELNVREGANVDALQTLAKIDDTDALVRLKAAELERDVALEQAEDDIDVQAAKAAADVAAAEVEESESINRRSPGSIPITQLRRQKLTQQRAVLQIKVAELEHRVAGMTAKVREAQVEVAALQVGRRVVQSPVDGRIEQVYRRVGEWVNPGDPIMRVDRLNRVRVEGYLSAKDFSPDEVDGRKVVVYAELERGQVEVFDDPENQIQFVSSQIDGNGEYRIWADVKNVRTPGGHWRLRPGATVRMVIELAP